MRISRLSQGFSPTYCITGPSGTMLPARTNIGTWSNRVVSTTFCPPLYSLPVQKSYQLAPFGRYLVAVLVALQSISLTSKFSLLNSFLSQPVMASSLIIFSWVYWASTMGQARMLRPNINSSVISHTFLSAAKSLNRGRM